MVRITFNPVEVAYKSVKDKPVIELYGISEGKRICVQVKDFEPYFWVTDKKAEDEKIVRVEEHKKNFLGKEITAKKVFVKQPSDVPIIREKFKALEADIPYTRRYMIDRKITPLLTYEVTGKSVKSDYKIEVIEADEIRRVSDEVPELKILAVDIETYTPEYKEIEPQKNPILMIAFYANDYQKVFLWKKYETNLGYVEFVNTEQELIEKFKQVVEEYKPDILTGYFSDGFDLPYIKTRADKYKIKLDLGLDLGGL